MSEREFPTGTTKDFGSTVLGEGPGTPSAVGTSMLGFPGTQKVATIPVSSGFIPVQILPLTRA
jgi:hypothetical protein